MAQKGAYVFYNCVVDTAKPRVLPNLLVANDGMTVDVCVAAAEAKGYEFAGLEYGRECWAGNALVGVVAAEDGTGGNRNASSVGECGMVCRGDGRQFCGGSSRVSLYVRKRA